MFLNGMRPCLLCVFGRWNVLGASDQWPLCQWEVQWQWQPESARLRGLRGDEAGGRGGLPPGLAAAQQLRQQPWVGLWGPQQRVPHRGAGEGGERGDQPGGGPAPHHQHKQGEGSLFSLNSKQPSKKCFIQFNSTHLKYFKIERWYKPINGNVIYLATMSQDWVLVASQVWEVGSSKLQTWSLQQIHCKVTAACGRQVPGDNTADNRKLSEWRKMKGSEEPCNCI